MKIYENNRAEILALLFLYTFKNMALSQQMVDF